MMTLLSASMLAALAVAVSFSCVERPSPTPLIMPAENAEGTRLLGRLPVAFVPNLGQWEHSAHYVARVGAMTVFLQEKGWTFTLVERTPKLEGRRKEPGHLANGDCSARGAAVRMTFAGASEPELVAEHQLPGRHHYFLGNDRSKWRSDVPLYSAVRYRDVHPGVDVRAREHDGHFEYDLLLQPGADLEPVEIVVEGIDRLHVARDGALVMETQLGPVRMPVPVSWEEAPSGEKVPVACRYVLRGNNRFGFEVPGRQPGWALVVDPGIEWSTLLGGGGWDDALTIAFDAQGDCTIAGLTVSPNFPTTPGAFDPSYNGVWGFDVFVTRLSPAGPGLVYSTYLGGALNDEASAVAVDAQGAATVAGHTSSSDFPTTPGAFSPLYNGSGDAFVTRLSPSGSSLVYSTFLGTSGEESYLALALDAQGAATVVGATGSASFPTTPGAFDTTFNGGTYDVFVTRLTPSGSSLVYSTFLGGMDWDAAFSVALDAQGACTVAGWTWSANFPTTPGAFATTHSGGPHDAWVARLSPTGAGLVYSTFLGGTQWDQVNALAVDAQGACTVAGTTTSPDFPTTPGAFDTSYNGAMDAFVARLSPSGSSLVYATFVGGAANDEAIALALDAQGAVTIAGDTMSPDFPTTPGAFDTSYNGGSQFDGDAIVTRLSPSGASLVYSTFLGGTNADSAVVVVLDEQGAATVAGPTESIDFPTTPGAFDTTHNGNRDGFITHLDMLPTGVGAYGNSSPGCNGPLSSSVNSMPRVGNASFALTCGNAAPNSVGLIAITDRRLLPPVTVLGVQVWVDPSVLFVTATVFSNSIGASEVPLPIPTNPTVAGLQFFAQFVWLGPSAPPPCPVQGFSASNALDFTIQP